MADILITGGSGQVGSRLVEQLGAVFSPSDKIYLLTRTRPIPNVDKKINTELVTDLESRTYDFAFHLAANTHTKYNLHPQWLKKFIDDNLLLTQKISDIAGKVLMLSTDNVFNGSELHKAYKESDKPNAVLENTYGVTKALAERFVLDKGGAVVRIETMLGVKSNLIVNRVFEAIDGKEYWPFWEDTFSRPSYFEDFIKTARAIYERSKAGVYHVSCSGQPLSRADISHKVLNIHRNHGFIIAFKEDEFKTEKCNDPNFPRHLVLDTQRTQQELNLQFTSIDEALENHVLYARNRAS